MRSEISQEQFDAHADKYAASAVHHHGPSLPVLLRLAAPEAGDRVLDVATGTGSTALYLAPHVHSVTGIDLSEGMLRHAREHAGRAGHPHVSFVQGGAEALPFQDASFTLVTSRHAPHHFRDAPAFLREVHRVLVPGGRFVLADQITPEGVSQEWVNTWQRLRDPSHYHQRTRSEWQDVAAQAGFSWAAGEVVPYRLEFDWWVRQSGCSAQTVAELERHAAGTSAAQRSQLGLEFDPTGRILLHVEPTLVARWDKQV